MLAAVRVERSRLLDECKRPSREIDQRRVLSAYGMTFKEADLTIFVVENCPEAIFQPRDRAKHSVRAVLCASLTVRLDRRLLTSRENPLPVFSRDRISARINCASAIRRPSASHRRSYRALFVEKCEAVHRREPAVT